MERILTPNNDLLAIMSCHDDVSVLLERILFKLRR